MSYLVIEGVANKCTGRSFITAAKLVEFRYDTREQIFEHIQSNKYTPARKIIDLVSGKTINEEIGLEYKEYQEHTRARIKAMLSRMTDEDREFMKAYAGEVPALCNEISKRGNSDE